MSKGLDFEKENSALLIIDMQNAFIHPEGSLSKMGLDTSRTSSVIQPIQQLKEEFNKQDRPIIYIQHTHRPDKTDAGLVAKVFPPIMELGHCFDGTWDAEIISELRPDHTDYIVKKHRYSAFYHTQLEEVMKGLGVESLVVTGIATNVCVESTIRDAFYRDINVFVPRECTASFTEEAEQGSFGNFEFAFARVVSVDEMKNLLRD
ncbi:cysteine hydrolase family protein [Oceanobacillus halophilus]|uniref:Cysteine hydrolase n=1 Tax=Oceanobacillus halophilus TaxID=930130 RepID=A0A495A7V1_9BACI|nr:isochorismatase family cysteine hydrolase [Oceanobacillus halophilus]RKQ35860.1 cysteine hydrolase [Oceanobacillus halophilus]